MCSWVPVLKSYADEAFNVAELIATAYTMAVLLPTY